MMGVLSVWASVAESAAEYMFECRFFMGEGCIVLEGVEGFLRGGYVWMKSRVG
jgi:hypothetical protein